MDVHAISALAFQTLLAAQSARSLSALYAAVEAPLRDLGFECAVGVDLVRCVSGHFVARHAFGMRLPEWEEYYQSGELFRRDPKYSAVRESAEPFLWSELPARRDLSTPELEVLLAAKKFGIEDVLTIPEHRPNSEVGAIHLIASTGLRCEGATRTAAHVIGTFYGSFARRLMVLPAEVLEAVTKSPLTARQRECLRWVSQGKSSADIGDILNLSKRTVEEHITGACVRLGVRTRVQAVAFAMRQGAI